MINIKELFRNEFSGHLVRRDVGLNILLYLSLLEWDVYFIWIKLAGHKVCVNCLHNGPLAIKTTSFMSIEHTLNVIKTEMDVSEFLCGNNNCFFLVSNQTFCVPRLRITIL